MSVVFEGIRKYYPKFKLPNKVLDADVREFARTFNEPAGSMFLEVGCDTEPICYSLAELGYNVVGIDTRGYYVPKKCKMNFAFVKGDFLKVDFKKMRFQSIAFISVLEHVGLGVYDDDPVVDGDVKAMVKTYELLNDGGHVYVTVPVGKPSCNGHWRVYNKEDLENRVIGKFKVLSTKYFASDKIGKYSVGDYIKEENAFESSGPEVSAMLVLEK